MSCLSCLAGICRIIRRPRDWPGNVWIDKYSEDAIDPDVEIIDPHHHLWDVRTQPKGWPIPNFVIKLMFAINTPEEINAKILQSMRDTAPGVIPSFAGRSARQLPFVMPYMAEELLFDIKNRKSGKKGHNIVMTVYLECGWAEKGVEEALKCVGEAHMAASVNKQAPTLCNGIVAHAHLMLEDVEKTLIALKKVPQVRGIRDALAWSDDPDIFGSLESKKNMAADPAFRKGFALLEKYDLSYDTWMFHTQLPDMIDLARAFPNTTIIIDHIAEPLGIGSYDREKTFPVWEKGMRELAQASKNVYVKLSGVGMCRVGFHLDDRPVPPSSQELAKLFAPYFNVVIDAFGVNRCMFASNFPVDRVSFDYTVMWNAFKLIVKDRSAQDKRALMYETAKRVYKL